MEGRARVRPPTDTRARALKGSEAPIVTWCWTRAPPSRALTEENVGQWTQSPHPAAVPVDPALVRAPAVLRCSAPLLNPRRCWYPSNSIAIVGRVGWAAPAIQVYKIHIFVMHILYYLHIILPCLYWFLFIIEKIKEASTAEVISIDMYSISV